MKNFFVYIALVFVFSTPSFTQTNIFPPEFRQMHTLMMAGFFDLKGVKAMNRNNTVWVQISETVFVGRDLEQDEKLLLRSEKIMYSLTKYMLIPQGDTPLFKAHSPEVMPIQKAISNYIYHMYHDLALRVSDTYGAKKYKKFWPEENYFKADKMELVTGSKPLIMYDGLIIDIKDFTNFGRLANFIKDFENL